MRVEIHDRMNDIVENDTSLRYNNEPIFKTFTDGYPSSLDETRLPCVMWLPRQDSGYERISGYNRKTVIEYDGRFYYALAGTGLRTIQNIRILTLPDLIINAFLSRPHLDYGDEGLSGLTGEIACRFISDLAVPLEYPIGKREPLYWGSIMRITIPYELSIELAP